MRIATWNMAYWSHGRSGSRHDEAWRWVFDVLKPDIFLCQECVVPQWVHEGRTVLWSRAFPGSNQAWGTGLVTSLPCMRARLPGIDEWLARLTPPEDARSIVTADSWLCAATVQFPRLGETLVASLHAPSFAFEKARLAGIDITRMKLKKNPKLWFSTSCSSTSRLSSARGF